MVVAVRRTRTRQFTVRIALITGRAAVARCTRILGLASAAAVGNQTRRRGRVVVAVVGVGAHSRAVRVTATVDGNVALLTCGAVVLRETRANARPFGALNRPGVVAAVVDHRAHSGAHGPRTSVSRCVTLLACCTGVGGLTGAITVRCEPTDAIVVVVTVGVDTRTSTGWPLRIIAHLALLTVSARVRTIAVTDARRGGPGDGGVHVVAVSVHTVARAVGIWHGR